MRINILFPVTAVALLLFPYSPFAQAPDLGVASSFALFTKAGAFNGDAATSVVGDIGTNAGAFTPPGFLVGATHIPPDPVAVLAATDVEDAYADLFGRICGLVLGTPFGNQTLLPNVYCLDGASVLDGTLTLDGGGNPNALFIFQIDGALSANPSSVITLINGANLCNVYFQVNGAVSLGTNAVFQGTIVAAGAINLGTGASLTGRGLTTMGAISTSANIVTLPAFCLAGLPTITCPPPVAVSCASQVPAADPSSVVVTVTCPGAFTVISLGDVISGQTCANRYTITRTYQVTDACGGIATCAQTITVDDQTLPTIICPADVVVSCVGDVPAANPAAIVTSDNCGGAVTVTSADVISNQLCPSRFTITRTYTATDDCGNVAMCVQTITVNDQTLPTITCPADVAVSCVGDVPAANPASVTPSDNCGGAVTVISADVISNQLCPNRFTITRTYTATDDCGNVAMCVQTITVNDQTLPTITCPADVVVSCMGDVPTANPASVTPSDNCGGAVTVISADVISNQLCPNRFTITRTYTATDDCGNVAMCVQTITVNDQTLPTITCPADVVVSCVGDVPAANPASIAPSDNCGGAVTVTSADVISNQLCPNRFTITRTYTATDDCGNVAMCVQTITVDDQTPPTSTCPANIAVACAIQVPAADPASVTASDNCGGAVTVTSTGDVITNQTCADRFTVSRTYQVTDLCGNSVNCVQTITVNGLASASVTCPANVSVSCASQVPVADPASVIIANACGGAVTVTSNDVISNQLCASRFTITRTYTATDACGNMAVCDQIITVNDQTPPIISCPANVVVSCVGQVPPGSSTAVTTSDNCGNGGVVVTFNDVISNQLCPSRFTITRTYTATDACGNMAVCDQIITVNDQTPPIISCPANVVVSCVGQVPPGSSTAVTTSDNCGNGAVVVTSNDVISNQLCPSRFTITRTYTATDACGNVAMCVQTITVDDQTPPTSTCPANIAVACAIQVPAADPASVTASDNCGGAVTVTSTGDVITNQTCADRFTVSRTYQVTDLCGNSVNCVQTITVNGLASASVTCPANVAVSCASQVPVADPASVIITNTCGGAVTVTSNDVISNQLCASRFTITRTYTATDACGNMAVCDQIITVNDQTPPIISCPANVVVSCAGQVPPGSNTAVTTSDNCGGAVVVTFNDVISNQLCASRFTITRTYTATDACGNMAVCAQIITVNDQAPPVISCPANVVVSCASQVPPGSSTAVTTSDNCGNGGVVVTFNDVISNQLCASRFTITRTYTATDACGNIAICAQIITVNDQTPPIISCPANVVVSCVSQVPPGSSTAVTTSDNCGNGGVVVTFNDVISNQLCASRFTITRTYTATDACGNIAICAQIITVNDQTPPIISCPANVVVSCVSQVPPGSNTAVTTSDNCGGGAVVVTFNDVISNQSCASRFTITRTYTATDVCGNVARCAQTITVNDQTPPTIICPVDVTVNCVNDLPVPAPATLVAADLCGGTPPVLSHVSDVRTGLLCANRFTVIRTYQADDACGNFTTCEQIITVRDQSPPAMLCPADITISCSNQMPVANPVSVVVNDNCTSGLMTVQLVGEAVSNQLCANRYTVTRSYQAIDVCGNAIACNQIITMNDQTPPVFVALPQNVSVECTSDYEAALNVWVEDFAHAQASDQCGAAAATVLNVKFISQTPGCSNNTFTRHYEITAIDACNNVISVPATFSVVDNTPPFIKCPPGNDRLTCEYDLPVPDISAVEAWDECGGDVKVMLTITTVGTGCPNYMMTTNYWFMATDECGNMSNCDQSFQIIDSIAPIYSGPDTINVSCVDDLPGVGDVASILAPYMSDNCSDIVCLGRFSTQNGLNSVTYGVKANDQCGNSTGRFPVTFVAVGTCQPLCSAPQATWSSPQGNIGDIPVTEAIQAFIDEYGGITAGKFSKTVTGNSVTCVQSILPGNGTTGQISLGKHLFSADNNCQPDSPLLNDDGTLKNALATNVMTMQMNIWYNLTFNDRVLGVQSLATLPSCLVDVAVLKRMEPNQKNVQGLLTLSNNYLVGVGFFPQGFGNLLNSTLDNLNRYWENCQENDPCTVQERNTVLANTSQILESRLAPNPVLDAVVITLDMAADADVRIRFIGSTGVQSERLVQAVKGSNDIRFSTKAFPSGIYTVVLQQDNHLETLRMIKVKD